MEKFEKFKEVMSIIMMLDNLDIEEQNQHMQDWYTLYKGYNHGHSVLDWAKENFNAAEVNKNTHDFWLDARGVKIIEIVDRFNGLSPKDFFPVFGMKKTY